jgi:aminopeptidase N
LLGEEKFRYAMDTYFETFDGQAVGTEDFLGAMQTQSPIDLTQFKRWYFQERTPTLHVASVYDAIKQTVTLTLEQKIPLNTKGEAQLPYAFPLSLALLSNTGEEFPLVTRSTLLNGTTLWVSETLSHHVFENITSPVALSLNRHFSAPIIIECAQLDYPFLMANDSDGFNRYEASQEFGIQTLEKMMHGEAIDSHFVHAYGKIIEDTCLEPLFKGELLAFPTLDTLMQRQEILNPEAIHTAIETLKKHLATTFKPILKEQLTTLHDPKNSAIDSVSMGKRALTHRYLGLLMSLEEESIALMCRDLYYESINMTTRLVALGLLDQYAPYLCGEALEDFYQRYANETLIMTKYFALCAASTREGTLQRVKALQEDRVFDPKIPNLVRALYGTFARNSVAFYDDLGEGFAFIADKVIELDDLNPQIASGLAGAFKQYRRLPSPQKGLMGKELQRIKNHPTISNNVYEIIEKIQGV